MNWDSILNWIAVAGAVGTASMGIVESMKVVTIAGRWSLATIGLGKVRRCLGPEAIKALELVYGSEAGGLLLEGAWRKGPEALEKVLQSGLRMAVFGDLKDLDGFIAAFGQKSDEISAAVKRLRAGEAAGDRLLDPATARERVARLEAAIDARVQAAVAAGRDMYASSCQCLASIVAVAGSVLVTVMNTGLESADINKEVGRAVLIGLIAIPIAPVAKDMVTFLNSLRTAFQQRSAKA